jgi:hypothetical protein
MNMKKIIIITAMLAITTLAGQAKTYKTIKTPMAMACVNIQDGELKAREVIFRDTATTVHFTMEYPKADEFFHQTMAQTELSAPLPDAPMADLIRSLCAKYPSRILVIDF